jgi:hypothetical protein
MKNNKHNMNTYKTEKAEKEYNQAQKKAERLSKKEVELYFFSQEYTYGGKYPSVVAAKKAATERLGCSLEWVEEEGQLYVKLNPFDPFDINRVAIFFL